jgi:hypothetical protein
MFHDVPRKHAAYGQRDILRRDGFSLQPSHGSTALTRYEFAVLASRGIRAAAEGGWKPSARGIAALHALAREFRRELNAMGQSRYSVLRDLKKVAGGQPMSDIGPDHWAHPHVKNLRDRGILKGYPDGTFGGE